MISCDNIEFVAVCTGDSVIPVVLNQFLKEKIGRILVPAKHAGGIIRIAVPALSQSVPRLSVQALVEIRPRVNNGGFGYVAGN